jgi:bifunctional non-homologous end joining protein LigD
MASDLFPTFVQPMLPTLSKEPFSNPGWIFEPKWDGYRAICFVRNGEVRLVSRRRNDLTMKFPQFQSIVKSIKARTAVLDGEIVALDQKGIPHFEGLRASRSADFAIVYFAFDLVYLNGDNLSQLPLIDRKAKLKRIVSNRRNSRLLFTDYVVREGKRLFAELEKQNLEGMVAKRADSFYTGGRTRDWLKIKTAAGREEMRLRSEAWKG